MPNEPTPIDIGQLLESDQFLQALRQTIDSLRSSGRSDVKSAVTDFFSKVSQSDSLLIDNAIATALTQLEAMDSAYRKRMEVISRVRDRSLDRIDRREAQATERAGGELPADQQAFFSDQRLQSSIRYSNQIKQLAQSHGTEFCAIQDRIGAYLGQSESGRVARTRKYYADIIAWTSQAVDAQVLSQEQGSRLIDQALAAQTMGQMRSARKTFDDYLKSRESLIERASRQESRLASQGRTDEIPGVRTKLDIDLKTIDRNLGKEYDLSAMTSEGLKNFGTGAIREALAAARAQMASWKEALAAQADIAAQAKALAEAQEKESGEAVQTTGASQDQAKTPTKAADAVPPKTAVKIPDAKEIEATEKAITAAEASIKERNPFSALALGIEKYQEAKRTGAPVGAEIKDIASAAAGSIGEVKGLFDAATAGMSSLGIEMNAQTSMVLADVSKLLGSAGSLATGIASGNPAQILTGGIGVITALFSLFDGKTRRAEQRIQDLQKEITKLSKEFDERKKQIDNTYDFSVYDQMADQTKNLQAQQNKIKQQIEEEKSKKGADDGKIAKWNDDIIKLRDSQNALEKQRIEMLSGTTITSAIDTFATALTEAYAKGEDGAKALGDTTKKVLANAVKEALKKKFLGEGMEQAVKYLGSAMEDGLLSDTEQQQFEEMTRRAGEKYMQGLAAYEKLFKDPPKEEPKQPDGLRGEISEKITENTATKLEGLFRLSVDLQSRMASLGAEQLTTAQSSLVQVADIARSNIAIEENTRRTADNTDGLRERLDGVSDELRAIKNNTANNQIWTA